MHVKAGDVLLANLDKEAGKLTFTFKNVEEKSKA
jgi:hypothetical protein